MLHLHSLRTRALMVAVLLIGMTASSGVAQSGSARAAWVSTAAGSSAVAAAVLPVGGGMTTAEQDAVGISGLLGAGAGTAVTSGLASAERVGVQSVASLANVDILDGRIKASGVIAIARVMQNGANVVADGLGSSISDLVVNGVSYDGDNLAPNTRVDLPGVGYVILNEIVPGAGSITVNMIHVTLTAPVTGLKIGEIVVGTASGSSGN